MAHCFVGLPTNKSGKMLKVSLYQRSDSGKMSTFRHVLWGDWLRIMPDDPADPTPDGWLRVNWKPNSPDAKILYVKKDHTTAVRPLEIIFVDVGQGDGAVLITPERGADEAIFVIDAGKHSHMNEFLRERFKTYKNDFQFKGAIITHPDEDHYGGFLDIFKSPSIGFDKVYQSGLVERPLGSKYEKLGGLKTDAATGIEYLQTLATSRADIEASFSDESVFGRTKFPPVMHAALNNAKIKDFEMLSTGHGKIEDGRTWLEGFAPSQKPGYQIEIVGPVLEKDGSGVPGLRKISSSYGKTKNGHSILLRLHIGAFKVLFGGDLNKPAEKFLLRHYADMLDQSFPTRGTRREEMLAKGNDVFGADIMKVCHHGASDVTDEFIEAVNPAAFVISSGDEEGHVHPKPDLLGRLGKLGRGATPVILSTELQRSTREEEDAKLVADLSEKIVGLDKKPTTRQLEEFTEKIRTLGRSNVSVFGSIYLKTDGKTLLTSFKKETGSQKDKWFSFQFSIGEDGVLKLVK